MYNGLLVVRVLPLVPVVGIKMMGHIKKATDSLRSNKKNQHQRQQQQQQHVQQQQQDCGRGQQQQYKSWVGTDVALLRACLDERASHRMCPS
ncbi:hypothetical protein VYU27_005574 [Nannochloropsis oceanica]